MKHVLLLFLAAFLPLLGSCSSSEGSDLAGVYGVDTSVLEPEIRKAIDSMPADQQAMADTIVPMMLEVFGNATFTISDDNTFEIKMSAMGQDQISTGTWAVDGDRITLTTTEENGNAASDTQVGTVGDGQISIEGDGPDGKPMALILKKK